MSSRKSGLGKNLNVFLSKAKTAPSKTTQDSGLTKLAIDNLQPGEYQPRKDMTQEALAELSESIKQQGLLQPIVARAIATDKYEIIAGERRWRASKLAGLTDVPVMLHEVDDKTALAMALVENIQREDLNPIEEARALGRLIDEFELTHKQVAEVVSKSRTSVTNLLRLMSLHPDVQRMLEHGDIEMGHARAILALKKDQQLQLAKQIIERHFTVRDTEAAVRSLLDNDSATDKEVLPELQKLKEYSKACQKKLAPKLQGKVKIKPTSSGQLKVEIIYGDQQALEQFIESLT